MKGTKRLSRALLIPAGLALSGLLMSSGLVAAQDKTVTVVLTEELADFDLCNSMRSTNGRVLRANIGESLTRIDPKDGSVTPQLATSWERVNDRTWHFTLRKGVKFHDGATFNADAVVKAINRTYHSPKMFCENRSKSGLKVIEAKVVDEYTVAIALDKPAPILPVRMGIVSITSPKEPFDALQVKAAIGTGPFKFESFSTGTDIVLVRNEDYWGAKPDVKRARYVFRKESSVRAAMVAVGEADLAPNVAVQDANDPAMDFSYLNSETSRLRIEAKVPPLNDRRVRLALNYALDRKALRGSVFSKDVLVSTQLVVPSIAGHNRELDERVWPYDPKKAMALLAEAKKDGVPVDKEIQLICRIGQWPGAQESQEAVMAYFQAAGFNIKLRCLEQAQHSDMNRKPYDPNRGPILFQDQHDNNNGDAVFTVFTKYGCDGEQSTVCDPETDKLTAKATAMPVGAERSKVWHEVFRRLYEVVVADVPYFHMVGYTRVGKRISYVPSIATNTEVELAKITFK
ncbi:MAG: peptide/nickel transport system substrate-binding protein [Gammaproteobacteria bacterium]|jgi:peptide/nickel transport system substrate-binding protein